jgi:2-dehydropantoate 2-reductase
MRVGVIGAGAVGGTLAALLQRSGHSVEVTARGAHLKAIRAHGLRLTGAWGDHTAAVAANEKLEQAPELVILATKAQDAAAALGDNIRVLSGIPLLVIQNGLDGVDVARRVSTHSDVVGGLAMFASSYLRPGQIAVTARGALFLGGGNDDADLPARFVERVMADSLPETLHVSVLRNFSGAQWTKLVVNQINALPAITGLSAQEVVADPQLLRILTASMQETVRVALARGVRFETIQGLSAARLRTFSVLPWRLGQMLPRAIVARMGSTPNPGSTLQSIRRGQSTEIDFLNGAVVRAGDEADVPTPVNGALVDLVHQVERTGDFVYPRDVGRLVPLGRAAA